MTEYATQAELDELEQDAADDYAALFHAAQQAQEKLQKRLVDNAIIGGAKDAAALLDNDAAVNQMAKLAFEDAVARMRPDVVPEPLAGPRRRPKRNLSAHKRAKAARKRNR